MKKWATAGITLFFPLFAIAQTIHGGRTFVKSVFVEPGYQFTTGLNQMAERRPEADYSRQYLITQNSFFRAGIRIQPFDNLDLQLAGRVRGIKAIDRYTSGLLEPIDNEVPYEEFSGNLSAAYRLGKTLELFGAASLLSAVRPRMEWQELPIGGEFVAVPDPYRDWMGLLGVKGTWKAAGFNLFAGTGTLQGEQVHQAEGSVTWYPLNNDKAFVSAILRWVSDTLNPTGRLNEGVQAGFRWSDQFETKTGCMIGRQPIQWEYWNGSVENLPDPAILKIWTEINFGKITRNMELSFRYQYTMAEATWDLYQYGELMKTETMRHAAHGAWAVLTWNFSDE